MKYLLFTVIAFMSSVGFAADLTPANLVGNYSVEAKVFFQRFYGTFRVLNTKEFDFQRTYPDGKKDEICTGSYTLNPSLFLITDTMLASGKVFQGSATCPSDRSNKMTLTIEFEDTTTEDLVRGTTLKVRTSIGGGVRVNAYVKKQ